MCISWCANQMNLRNARCNDKDKPITFCGNLYLFYTQYFQNVPRSQKLQPLSLVVIYRQMILVKREKQISHNNS